MLALQRATMTFHCRPSRKGHGRESYSIGELVFWRGTLGPRRGFPACLLACLYLSMFLGTAQGSGLPPPSQTPSVTPSRTPSVTPSNIIPDETSLYLTPKAQHLYSCRQTVMRNYDSSVVPLPPNGPLQVNVDIVFLSVAEARLETGEIELRVWLDLMWTDTRLVWEPSDYGGHDSIVASASELWTPPIELLNYAYPLEDTLEPEKLVVFNNGSVLWSRPGTIEATCALDNLRSFPADYPKCMFEFGSSHMLASELTISTHGRGWSIMSLDAADDFLTPPLQRDGTRSKFAGFDTVREFVFHRIETEEQTYANMRIDGGSMSVLQYTITIRRLTYAIYFAKTILPNILLAAGSFFSFNINPECRERLTLMSFIVFIQVSTQMIFTNRLAHLSIWTGLLRLNTFNIYITIFSFFETAFVVTLHWGARTAHARKPDKNASRLRKLLNPIIVPRARLNDPNELPELLKRQQTHTKLRAQQRIAGGPTFKFSKTEEREKTATRVAIKQKLKQDFLTKEGTRLREMRYRFVATQVDKLAAAGVRIAFIWIQALLFLSIASEVAFIESSNIGPFARLGQ